jgi:hypothetical protein
MFIVKRFSAFGESPDTKLAWAYDRDRPITDIADSSRIAPRLGEFEASFGWTWDRVLSFLKLLFETGCADISVRAEWAAGMLSAGIKPPKTDNPFVPVSH